MGFRSQRREWDFISQRNVCLINETLSQVCNPKYGEMTNEHFDRVKFRDGPIATIAKLKTVYSATLEIW